MGSIDIFSILVVAVIALVVALLAMWARNNFAMVRNITG